MNVLRLVAQSGARSVWLWYAGIGALQGALGLCSLAALSYATGVEGVARWGLQQLFYQGLSLALTFGLPPIVAASAVRIGNRAGHAVAAEYRSALALLTPVYLLSLIATLFLLLIGQSMWLAATVAASGASAVLQVVSANLRGIEQHRANCTINGSVWLTAYVGAIAATVWAGSPDFFWIPFSCFLNLAALSLLIWARPRYPNWADARWALTGIKGLPHLVANSLSISLMRPIAGALAGAPGIAAVTIVGQYSQGIALLQQSFWSARTPDAIRFIERKDGKAIARLTRSTYRFMGVSWFAHLLGAPVAIYLLSGSEIDGSTLAMAGILGLLPLASVTYDINSSVLWRRGSTSLITVVTVFGLAFACAAAYTLGSVNTALIPVGLLAMRLAQGEYVRRKVSVS